MKNSYKSEYSHISIAIYCLCIVIISLFNQGCSEDVAQKPDAGDFISPHVVSTQAESNNIPENKLINQAKKIVTKYKLSELPLICLKFDVLEKLFEGKRIIDVREKHGGSCGGDPNISPRLFSIGIEQSTGVIWSDAKSMLGQLERLELK